MRPATVRVGAGWVLTVGVAIVMILAGAGKVFGFAPDEVVEGLREANLDRWINTIGVGAMAAGLLLLVPHTLALGAFVSSSYWGGAILMHMTLDESFALPASLLVATWVGVALRDPGIVLRRTRRAPDGGVGSDGADRPS